MFAFCGGAASGPPCLSSVPVTTYDILGPSLLLFLSEGFFSPVQTVLQRIIISTWTTLVSDFL